VILPLVIFAQVSGVQIKATVTPATVYVGQQLSYDVGIQMNVLAQTSFQTNPEYSPPDVQAANTYDFPFDTASIKDVKTASGLSFRQFLYHRAIFPLTAGKFTIPKPALKYTLPNEADPFDTPKEYAIEGSSLSYTVIPVPDAGKPADFTGAVGQFTATASTNATAPRVGESFTLTMTVTGDGDIKFLPRPDSLALRKAIPWAKIISGKDSVGTWDSTGTAVHGTKTFQWLVNPTTGGQQIIPALRYAYFDPATKQYTAATTAPLTINVAGSATGSAVQQHNVSTSPFPAAMKWIGSNILIILIVLVVVIGLVFGLVKLAKSQEPID
jgi:hypothetical protein